MSGRRRPSVADPPWAPVLPRPSRTSPSWPASRGRPSRTRSTTPTCCAPTPSTRVQEAIAELGYTPNRAARNLRTRSCHLIGMRYSPVQEGTANALMDRFVHSLVEECRDAGYHVLLFAADTVDPIAGYHDLLRSTAVDAFVVTDTYLGNPPATWLEERRVPFVAFGRPWEEPEATPPVGRRRRRRRRRPGHHPPDRARPPRGSRGSAGARTPGSARTGVPAGPARCASAASPPPGSRPASRTPSPAGATRPHCCSTRPGRRRSSAPPTPSRWGCCTRSTTAACGSASDVAVVGFDDSQPAQVVPPGITSVRQPLEEVAVEVVGALNGLLARPRVVHPPRLLARP